MTSSGSAYARFRRALKTGNVHIIRAAAAELPQIALADALEVCAVLARERPARYERAAVRWLARYCLEHRADLEDLNQAVAGLRTLPGDDGRALLELRALLDQRPADHS